VAYYRLYFMDHLTGPECVEFEAESDSEAIEIGDERRGMALAELWSDRRKVQRWEALSPYSPKGGTSASLSS
jgi:hypothetical protein